MIDALTAWIAYIGSDADLRTLIGDRIAAKHRFAMGQADNTALSGWETPAQALQLAPDPGTPSDTSSCGTMERMRLEARCYGDGQVEAAAVYNRLVALSRGFQRTTVLTGAGRALLYWFQLDGSPQFDRDPDVRVDFYRAFFLAASARDAVD